ncbi:putative receptor-like protein kinase At3g47110 [Solanum tuberosum]|uniref:putative receptor-like protein kinase At3g47110 n=1 Tax=Solanum tuberosum TaxID=4113 RepID=UPI0003D23FA4|nr:PREDICTED: putative receptor-like protein kinase At3g47110 [Solanum tuberosum]
MELQTTFVHSSSLFFLSFHAILFMFLYLSFPECASAGILGNQTDKLALLDLKSQITEDPQGLMDSWNATLNVCQWPGVTCGHKHQRVISLDLKDHRLAGTISPSIGNLSFLRILDISDNSFHGVIPPELGQLIRLQTMNLSFNFLRGEIPLTLSRCVNVVNLILDHNILEGHIPTELGSLTKLEMLYLKNNNLTGNVPNFVGNLTSLRELYISYNDLEGELPETMANMRSLIELGVSVNSLSGEFPPALYNLSSLTLLSLSFNKFRGRLRPDIGLAFPNLQRLYLANNYFTGSIPASLSNCSDLLRLDIPLNNFTGNIPLSFGNLKNLLWLNVNDNQLGVGAPDDLNFINSLTNCKMLEFLDIANNKFGGMLPYSITNLSTTLTKLLIGYNRISGTIPREISNLVNLDMLSIQGTLINGSIPDSIGMLSNLKNLHMESNQLTGNIPSSLGNIRGLLYIYLQDNSLEGTIPSSLGNCTSLQTLDIAQNKLSGSIPKQVIALSSLSVLLNMSYNSLSGPLPVEIGNLTNLAALDISNNKLSGEIPHSLESCSSLEILYLQENIFEGTIPPLDDLKNIQYLDLSRNTLSGNIPRSITKHVSLQNLNLSFNHLDGEVPVQGVFSDASRIQVMGNMNLCGGIEELHLHPCLKHANKRPQKHIALILVLALGTSAACLTLLLLVSYCCVKKGKHRPSTASSFRKGYTQVSYEELLNATGGFSSNNLIGSGSFGSVYRGNLSPEGTIAVKVLKLEKKGASKSFLAECEALRNIRHRNLVKISTVCSSVDFDGNDFKALIYPFMENGSLDEWLHPKEGQMLQKRLSILHRLNITIDVASALHYLHSQCHTSIVHCDLKPSNVLLDNDLTALVSDFGLAKFLSDSGQNADVNQFSTSGIKGTVGYAAPEYGMGGQVSCQGDVYSFGILLLEIFTGRRPTSELFEDNETLHSFVKQALPGQVMDVVDQSALYETEPGDLMDILSCRSDFSDEFVECLVSILTAGVSCSEETPHARISMGQVILDLISIRNKLSRILVHSEKVKISRKGES